MAAASSAAASSAAAAPAPAGVAPVLRRPAGVLRRPAGVLRRPAAAGPKPKPVLRFMVQQPTGSLVWALENEQERLYQLVNYAPGDH